MDGLWRGLQGWNRDVLRVNGILWRLFKQGDAQLGDGQLLEAFVVHRDQSAFAALVERYGGMVLGVCRRVLRHEADAEDAFQATFLVLVRKAGSIRKHASVGSWLYGVAFRTARHLKMRDARRRLKEAEARPVGHEEPSPDQLWCDLQPLLDRELARLPERYREAVVLCDLLGQTKREAAEQLHIPEGTLSSRLARAREMLRRRLADEGPALATGSLAAALAEHALSAPPSAALVAQTVQCGLALASGGAFAPLVSARIANLTQEILGVMLLSKIKVLAVICLAFASTIGLAGLLAGQVVQDPTNNAAREERAPAPGQMAQPIGAADAAPAALSFQMVGIPGLVRFSPDVKTLLAVSTKKLVQWDLTTGRQRREIALGDQSRGYAAAVSPDGKVLALGDVDGSIRRWELATGKLLPSFRLPKLQGAIKEEPPGGPDANAVGSLAFSADGKTLTAVGWDRKIHVWDTATGDTRVAAWNQDDMAVATVLFSAGGKRVAVASDDWHTRVHDLDGGKPWYKVAGMPRAFTADGKRLCLMNYYQRIRLVDAATGKEIFKVGDDIVRVLAFSFDGKLLALADGSRCELWDASAGKRLLPLPVGEKAVTALAFAPGAKLLAVASAGGTIKLVNLKPRVADKEIEDLVRGLSQADVKWDGQYFGIVAHLQSERAKKLGAIGEPAIPALIKALTDKDRFASAHAILAMIASGSPPEYVLFNGYPIDVFLPADGKTFIDPAQRFDLKRRWQKWLETSPSPKKLPRETNRERFRRLLQAFSSETDEVKWLGLQQQLALTSGKPEAWLLKGSTDARLAALDDYLREAVTMHLSKKDIPRLVQMAERAPHVPTRNYAIHFLVWMDAREAIAALRRLMNDKEETVRRNAARAVEVLERGGGGK
jgi:RNA polymerase sigma factor (sigma-70 family)